MYGFLRSNDFNGIKDNYPVSTSYVSPFSDSENDLRKLAKDVRWHKGKGFKKM